MNDSIESNNVPPAASVRTVHILSNGDLIYSLEDYEKVKERFAWVDRSRIVAEILRLRRLTEVGKQSIIAVYEDGETIKAFLNLEDDFHPSDLQIVR